MQPWYPFYWSDYSGKTFDLSQGQHGAYILLLRWVYVNGRPIPQQQCYSIARAVSEHERENVDFVLASFFELTDGAFSNLRALEVIAEAEAAHERRVNAGRSSRKGNAQPQDISSDAGEQCSSNAPAIPPTTTTTTTIKKDTPPKPPREKREQVALPEWLPASAWDDWVTYRRSRRLSCAPITLQKQINQLNGYRNDGHSPTDVIDTAIARGWQGLYPPKGDTHGSRNTDRRPTPHENLLAGFGITNLGKP